MDKFRPESFLPLTPVAFEILLALADGERHGYSILQEVETRSGGAVSLHAGTLYRALARLLESDLIDELRQSPDPSSDDERRRYYRLTHARHRGGARGSGTARGTTRGGPHPPPAERRQRVRELLFSHRAPRLPASVSSSLRRRNAR